MNIKAIAMIACAAALSTGCMSGTEPTQEANGIEHSKPRWSINVENRILAGFHLWEDLLYFADDNGTLYCVDKTNGAEKFRYESGSGKSSTPVIYEDKLYFLNGKGLLSVLDPLNGTLLKNKQFEKTNQKDEWDYFISTPVYEDGVIYVGAQSKQFYALDADSLEIKWEVKTSGAVHSKARILDSVVLVGDMIGYTYCINKDDGEVIWKHRAMGPNMGTYAVLEDTIYFGSRDTYTYGLSSESGDVKWRQNFGSSWIMATPLAVDSLVITGMSDAHKIVAQDAESGEIVWSTKASYNITCEPVLYKDDKIVFTAGNSYDKSGKGGLFVLDKNNGEMVYRFNTTSSFSEAVLDGDLAYFANEKGEVFCVEITL